MQKRGQIDIKVVMIVLICAIVSLFLILTYDRFLVVKDKQETVEILNLKTSIQTRILQQSVKSKGTVLNTSFSVPSTVSEVCFFDANAKYSLLKNPEISGLYFSDKKNNLFLKTEKGLFAYDIDKLMLEEEYNPLCLKIINNRVTVQLDSSGQYSFVSGSLKQQQTKCISVLENGHPDDKVDIVFMGYGFKTVADYNKEVNRYINNIMLEFSPFRELKYKFNFYRIDDAKLSCTVDDFVSCDHYSTKVAASDCPNDHIIVLVERSLVKDFVKPVRSSTLGNVMKINTADKPFVLVHEFGHAFSDLADEYVDERFYTSDIFNAQNYVNCDNTPCPNWEQGGDTGCYAGCSLKRYYRPTRNSIMRSLNSPTFGSVNEGEIKRRLLFYE